MKKMLSAALVLASVTFAGLALPNVSSAAVVISNQKICTNYDPFKDEYKKPDGPKYKVTPVASGHQFLAKGTIVPVKVLKAYDSRTAKKNELVDLEVTDNVYYNGYVVIPSGTKAIGYMYDAAKAGGFGKKGALKIAGLELTTSSGFKVPLMKGLIGRGKNDGGAVAVAAAVTLIGGAFMKGTNVTCEAGTEFECEVREDTDLGY